MSSCQILVFANIVLNIFTTKLEILILRDIFNILLEKRSGTVAGQRYTMLYGKSRIQEIKGNV